MKIEYDGRTWQFDDAKITVEQAETVYEYAELTLGELVSALSTDLLKPPWMRVLRCLYWLMLAQNDPEIPPTPADVNFPLGEFATAYTDALAAEVAAVAAKQAKPDPTRLPVASPRSPASPTPRKPKTSARAAAGTGHG